MYSNDWGKVNTLIPSRSKEQVRSHAQKFIQKLINKYISKWTFNDLVKLMSMDDLISNNDLMEKIMQKKVEILFNFESYFFLKPSSKNRNSNFNHFQISFK